MHNGWSATGLETNKERGDQRLLPPSCLLLLLLLLLLLQRLFLWYLRHEISVTTAVLPVGDTIPEWQSRCYHDRQHDEALCSSTRASPYLSKVARHAIPIALRSKGEDTKVPSLRCPHGKECRWLLEGPRILKRGSHPTPHNQILLYLVSRYFVDLLSHVDPSHVRCQTGAVEGFPCMAA